MRRAKAFGPLLLSRACAPQVQAGLVGAEYAVEVEAEALILPPSPPSSAGKFPKDMGEKAGWGIGGLSLVGMCYCVYGTSGLLSSYSGARGAGSEPSGPLTLALTLVGRPPRVAAPHARKKRRLHRSSILARTRTRTQRRGAGCCHAPHRATAVHAACAAALRL